MAEVQSAEVSVEEILARGSENPQEDLESIRAGTHGTLQWARRGFRPQRLAVAICPDKPGLLAALTEPMATRKFNLEGVSSDAVAGYFVFMAQCARVEETKGSWEEVTDEFARVASEKDGFAKIMIADPVEELWPRPGSILVRFEVALPDSIGCVATFTRVIWEARYALETMTSIVTEEGGDSVCRIDAHVRLHDTISSERASDDRVFELQTRISEALGEFWECVRQNLNSAGLKVFGSRASLDPNDVVSVRAARVQEIQPPTWGVPRTPIEDRVSLVATGLAQPGFVLKAFELLAQEKGNVVGSAMSVLEGRTCLLAIVEGTGLSGEVLAERMRSHYRQDSDWKSLGPLGRPWGAEIDHVGLGEPVERDESANCVVRANPPDRPGVLHRLSLALGEVDANIVRLRTFPADRPYTTIVRLHASLPGTPEEAKAALEDKYCDVAEEMGWEEKPHVEILDTWSAESV